jgi:hypothetical protein
MKTLNQKMLRFWLTWFAPPTNGCTKGSDPVAYKRGDYRDKWRIERIAQQARSRIGLDQLAVLDPNLLVEELGARVFHLRDLIDDERRLARARQIAVDGAASRHPETGEPLILLNCGKPRRRRLATLMSKS